MPKEGLVALELVGGLVSLPVEGAARIARIHLGRFGTHLAEPVEEVRQVSDDVRGVQRRARRPAQATRVEASLSVEGSGVEPLGEVLEQSVGVALGGVGLQVLKEHPHRAIYLRHPHQASVVTAMEAVVEQWLQHASGRQEGG
ncbi:hypothetical protein [Ralstonia syzygii]|uniref:hypothetical protein n=1 Tax=Ralstonia syzygii TaxID=28097 RepID=UPI001E64E761|nr:hypothetical protein [Ralstonia syzygii]